MNLLMNNNQEVSDNQLKNVKSQVLKVEDWLPRFWKLSYFRYYHLFPTMI